jgi:thiamine-phosphate pyrophosphorylase
VAWLRGRDVAAVVAQMAGGGARILQLRMKSGTDAHRLALARAAVTAAHAAGALLLVNDRPDLALLSGADGMHVGQDDLPPREARRALPRGAIVGVSTHTLDQFRAAAAAPVDYIAVGPVFATTSKERPDAVVGTALVRAARECSPLPIVAIGGITAATAPSVIAAGASGIAVIRELLEPDDARAATRVLVAALAAGVAKGPV